MKTPGLVIALMVFLAAGGGLVGGGIAGFLLCMSYSCTFRDYLIGGPDRLILDGGRVSAQEHNRQTVPR